MEENTERLLLETIIDFINNPKTCIYSKRDILSLGSRCVSQKANFLKNLKKFLNKRYRDMLAELIEGLQKYNQMSIFSLEASKVNEVVAKVYGEGPLDAEKTVYFEAISDAKHLRAVLENLLKELASLSMILAPLSEHVYYLDKKVNHIEKVFMKVMFVALKKNLENVMKFFTICIFITKELMASSSDGNPFIKDIKYLLDFLEDFGLKPKLLNGSKGLLAEYDINHLKDSKTDFNFVFQYFKSQRYIYPERFQRKIEKTVFYSLYNDLCTKVIADKLLDHGTCTSLYEILCKGDLKSKLFDAFSILLPKAISHEAFPEFVKLCEDLKKTLLIFKDADLEKLYSKYFEKFLDVQSNSVEISNYVDMVLRGKIDEKTEKSLDFVVEIVENSASPESLLNELQIKLAQRLIHFRNGDRFMLSEESKEQISNETLFLSKFKKMYSENMTHMVKDVSNILKRDCGSDGQEESKNNSLLLMTMCKWPVFKTDDVFLSGESEINLAKKSIEAELKDNKRRISWVDSLSNVVVELFGKVTKLTLFQYGIVNIILNEGTKTTLHGKSTAYLIDLDKKILPVYKKQFLRLLNDLILVENARYTLNPSFENKNYVHSDFTFQSSKTEESQDSSYCTQSFDDARVSKIMKRLKSTTIPDLRSQLPDLEESMFQKTIQRLQEKGIIEVSNEKVNYCP